MMLQSINLGDVSKFFFQLQTKFAKFSCFDFYSTEDVGDIFDQILGCAVLLLCNLSGKLQAAL
ncbi:TPA: hypothetical protein L6A36_19675 [Pseudomonas aeruginosa]|nr:hypothetical protein [Pseudomonas aeruginosa]